MSEEPMHPFEHMAAENKNRQNGGRRASSSSSAPLPKKTKQTMLAFSKKEPAPDDEDEDDDDDNDLGGFDFGQHKASAKPQRNVPTLTVPDDSKKKKEKREERILVRTKWPKGKVALPEGWTARSYRSGASGKEYWVFSHAHYGETTNKEHTKRTEEQWKEAMARRHSSGKSSTGSKAGCSGREEDGEGSEEEAATCEKVVDPLAALLRGKRQRDEEDDQIREQVHEEMSMRMDTGVRCNPALKDIL